jgi:hypothetical protein
MLPEMKGTELFSLCLIKGKLLTILVLFCYLKKYICLTGREGVHGEAVTICEFIVVFMLNDDYADMISF